MIDQRAAVLAVLRPELGTVEKPPNSNRTKYGKAYGMDGHAWCAMLLWWAMRKAGLAHLVPKSAYTPTIADWFRKRGQWHTSPQVGDWAFFDFAGDGVNRISHVAIVEAVNRDGSVITIEGNTSPGVKGSQRDGGGVYRRTRTRAGGIVGYGRPAYATGVTLAAPAPTAGLVRALQQATRLPLLDDVWGPATDGAINLVRDAALSKRFPNIIGLQNVIGTRADGQWGPASAKALDATVFAIQRALGVTADGRWGPGTDKAWAAARSRFGRGL